MSLRSALHKVAQGFPVEKKKPLKGNEFADYVRSDLKQIFESVVLRQDLRIKASVGAGNWAEIPWIGLFNEQITTSATHGIYVVFLYSADAKDLYLCLGQGVTSVKQEFGKEQKRELLRRAELLRSRVPEHSNAFRSGPINLNGTTTLAREYNDAVSFYIHYETDLLPGDDNLEADLYEMLRLYDLAIERGGTDNIETFSSFVSDADDRDELTIEEKRAYVRHSRIERNTSASKKAKAAKEAICEGCGFNFKKTYGEHGDGYIEAHHLIPLHTLPFGQAVSMDPVTDFALLCANCHRMVHRRVPMLSLDELKRMPGVKLLRELFKD